MKNYKRKQTILIFVSISLLVVAIFQSIYVDGIAVALTVVFPFSLLILIATIISFIFGYKRRKEVSRWYVQSLIIISMGLMVLWTPFLKHSRSFLERNWRWDARNEVVSDIKSGDLTPFAGMGKKQMDGNESYYVLVPFGKYGRVSFDEVHGNENAVEVHITPETGYMITFTTNGGFFGPKSQLIYVEKEIRENPFYDWINKNWFNYEEEFSLLVN